MPSSIPLRRSLRSVVAGGVVAALALFSALVAVPASAADQPFAVTSPANGSAVDSTAPTFTGTGTTGDTVTLVYSGQELGSYVAGSATVGDDGTWSTGTDFSSANPGETETRVRVTETAPDGTEVGTFFITITFPEAPVRMSVFTLESPQDGETRDDFLNIVHFVGAGDPGNTITVRYFANGGLAVAGEGQVDQSGRFDVFATFRELPAGQDFANTFTRQTTPSGDLVAGEIGRTIFFATPPVEANPFTVTSPQNFETVDTLTPAFTGTGVPGDTVTLTYGGQQLGTYVAGTTTVGEDGAWTIPTTDFSKANFGESSIRVLATATSPSGEERSGAVFINVQLPSAPVPQVEFTLTSPQDGETRDDFLNIVHFTGTGVPGNTITVRYFDGRGGLAVAGVGEVRSDGTFDVFTTFRDLPAGQDFANTFTMQTDPSGALVAPEIGRTIFFVNAPVPLYPFTVTSPQNGGTVDTLTPAYTGTGTPGDTVTVSYSGQGLLTYVAGTTTVGEDGTWTIPTTDFSKAPFGDTEVRTRVVETTPDGVEVNDGTLFITITFPTAPAVPVLDTPTLDQPTVAARRATFRGMGEPGATVEITVTGATTTTVTTTVRPNGNYRASTRLPAGSYTATATQFTGDGDDRSAASAARSFTVRGSQASSDATDVSGSSRHAVASSRTTEVKRVGGLVGGLLSGR